MERTFKKDPISAIVEDRKLSSSLDQLVSSLRQKEFHDFILTKIYQYSTMNKPQKDPKYTMYTILQMCYLYAYMKRT